MTGGAGRPRERVVVAMSGGVDSSVAAALLQAEGCDVVGVTLRLRDCDEAAVSRSCCGIDGQVRARDVAQRLGIHHYVLDCVTEFEQRVLRPAWEEYARARTPSPCLHCNEQVKLGLLVSWARSIGARRVATGHYARIEREASGRVALLRGIDRGKDQSYFLAGIGSDRLRSVLLPVGAMTKPEVRALAGSMGLPCASTPESQDACLVVGGEPFAEMLRRRFGAEPRAGAIVDDEGAVLGSHDGIHRFTVGQRRRIPIRSAQRRWVRRIGCEPPVVMVTADERALLSGQLTASGVTWVDPESQDRHRRCQVQVRSAHVAVEAELQRLSDARVRATFAEPVRAAAPGQAAVFYDGERVLGRGWIDDAC